MTVAEAIETFLRSQVDRHSHLRAVTLAEIMAGVKAGTPASRSSALNRLVGAGKVHRFSRRRREADGRFAQTFYRAIKSQEWCEADQRLVEQYEQREREATVKRRCLCCREMFTTTEAYRLCASCRNVEATTARLQRAA